MQYKLADAMETITALSLVREKYLRAGLVDNPEEIRFSPSKIFVGKQQDRVFCTMSLIPDDHGLPMEPAFPEEVQAARALGKVAEVGRLAFDCHTSFRIHFKPLAKTMACFAREIGIEVLLIAVHPAHVFLYQRFMGFEVIGKKRPLSYVNDSPAVPCQLEFAAADKSKPPFYDSIFTKEGS